MKSGQNMMARVLGMGVAIAALAGTAAAQSEFKKPLKPSGKAEQSSAKSTTTMRQDDGENRVEVRISGDEVSAKVNGKAVASDRIVREKDRVKVLDKDGGVISEFSIGGDTTVMFGAPDQAQTWRAAPEPGIAAWGGMEPPKVMIGITMDEPAEALRKNYDLKPGEAIFVQRVIEGLPAEKAGLKASDIITEIDGRKPVSQEVLREILSGKEPGDTVKFTVLRKGGDETVRVTLEKYDVEKLGASQMPQGMSWPAMGDQHEMNKDVEQAMREAMRQGGQFRSFRLPDGDGRAFVYGGQGADSRVAELDKKMAELDEKLARMDEKLTKLQELIEKLAAKRN
jgi:hypothetical protein